MNEFLVKVLVAFWASPLFVRELFAGIGKMVYMNSSNSRCKEYISQIERICKEKDMEISEALKKDIINTFIITGLSPFEFFLFNLKDKTMKERDEYISDANRTQILKKISGLELFERDLFDKYSFYCLNIDYFHRKCIKVTSNTSFEEFCAFVKEQGTVFIKVNAGSFGYNAHKVTFTNEDDLKKAFQSLNINSGAEWIAEGLVIQDERLAVWNASSVNTIRIPSYLVEGGRRCEIYRPFIRTGREGSVVDNAGLGGIFAVIDEVTGKIITDGADESSNRYIKHPDSNITFKGWQVPMWNELLSLAQEAHLSMPNHKYIAYDFALTKTGWVMIEGNWGQYVCQQTATQIGAKARFKELMKK